LLYTVCKHKLSNYSTSA